MPSSTVVAESEKSENIWKTCLKCTMSEFSSHGLLKAYKTAYYSLGQIHRFFWSHLYHVSWFEVCPADSKTVFDFHIRTSMVKNLKNCPRVDFDTSKEASWWPEFTAKKTSLSSLQDLVSAEIKENCQNWPFWKKYSIGQFFLIFFLNLTLQRDEVFCIAFSASRSFFWAIKINSLTICHSSRENNFLCNIYLKVIVLFIVSNLCLDAGLALKIF